MTKGMALAFVLLAGTARADIFDAAAISASVADVVTTEVALSRGYVEQNIQNRGARLAANALLTSGTLLLAREIKKSGHPGWARALKVAHIAVFSGIAIKNARTMRGGR